MPDAEVVATGIHFPEGPVWCPPAHGTVEAGSIVCTSVADGALERIDLATGTVTRVADVGGGANAAWPVTDGGFLVTQNGGIDFAARAPGMFDPPPPYRPVTPGIQRVYPDGSAEYLADDGFLAPNDLVVRDDGVMWFTDPPHFPPPADPVGTVHRMDPDGTTSVVADGFHYCNGIALEPGGTLAVIEARGVLRLDPATGEREWIVGSFGEASGDGMALDVDGRLYVCCTSEHAVRVFEPDGSEVDRLQVPGQGLLTNCCFGGPDLRTLFVAQGVPGSILAFEGLATPGLAVNPWPVPTVG